MPSVVSSSTLLSAFAADCRVDDFALTPGERRFVAALHQRQVRFILLDMGAGLLEGVPSTS